MIQTETNWTETLNANLVLLLCDVSNDVCAKIHLICIIVRQNIHFIPEWLYQSLMVILVTLHLLLIPTFITCV